MTTPDFLKTGMAQKSAKASLSIDCEDGVGAVLITSKINGIAGNQISVAIEYDDLHGPATCSVDGLAISYRIPNFRMFEASGPFSFNGVAVKNSYGLDPWIGLWYAGDFNGKKSYSLAGDPAEIQWPLTDDGEFMLFAAGAWHMLMRVGGVELYHWQTTSNVDDVQQLPHFEYSAETPTGWQGIVPGCMGYVIAHYAAPINEAQYLSFITEGSEIAPYLPGNAVALSLLHITVPNGAADDNKFILSTTRRNLDGGK